LVFYARFPVANGQRKREPSKEKTASAPAFGLYKKNKGMPPLVCPQRPKGIPGKRKNRALKARQKK
jgi:hypothetical protein